jgi:hypothetical protein
MFNTAGAFTQQLTIPQDAESADLSFWLNVTSNESSANPQDVLTVAVTDPAGEVLEVLATFSSRDRGAAGVYEQQTGYDLLADKGQPIQLRFQAQKGLLRNTTFRIDDVKIE